jgi:mycofactocin system glycosyltransferase
MLSAHPPPVESTAELAVVVPVRDRPEQLARCLDAIARACPESEVVVVDDGSVDSTAVVRVCGGRRVRVIRHATPRGAAAARNSGLAACSTEFVGFVDSDIVLPGGGVAALMGHFADPRVAAVAPRVRALPPCRGLIGGYEERHSTLDMGAVAGRVAPGLRTAYVPSAVLLVRRSAVGGGFDESMDIGEDIDLVWRLWRAGWRVEYKPEVHVLHEHRVRFRDFVQRRRVYARSVALLARRHPDALPATWVSPWMAVPWALGLAGRHRTALAAAAIDALLLGRKLRGATDDPYRLAGGLVGRGLLATGVGLAQAVRRAWTPPLAVVAVTRPAARRILLAAFAIPIVHDAMTARAPRKFPGDAAVRLLDEAIAGAGTWEGCVRYRTVHPLLPSLRTPR